MSEYVQKYQPVYEPLHDGSRTMTVHRLERRTVREREYVDAFTATSTV